MTRRRFVSIQLVLVSLAAIGLAVIPNALGSGGRGPCTRPLRYGFVCQTDRAFYASGSTARVQFAQFNFSRTDVYGYATGPGLGCDYGVRIRDANDNLVWIPGGVELDGSYRPPVCGAAIFNVQLLDGCVLSRSVSVPLIFQNPSGVGSNGAPLPPGFYRIEVFSALTGPHRTPPPQDQVPPGYSPLATVPIQIE